MTRTLARANREIGAVDRMPYGLARTQAAERQVRITDAEGPEAAVAYALAVLVESLHWGGEPEKAFLPFTRMVRWWDERPDLFDESDRHTLFWQYKWMVTDLPDHPTVPAAQIDAALDDMERRYALAGHGRDAVAYARFRWAWERNADDVGRWFEEWVVTPRDAFSQCETCDPSNRADHLISVGRVEEGVRLIEETVESGGRCSSEPANMLLALALGYQSLGRPRDAVSAYRRAIAALADAKGEMLWFRGRRIVLLGRGGQPARAVAAIEQDAALLLDGAVPGTRLGFLHDVVEGAAALLPQHADLPVRAAGVPVSTLGALHAWAVAEAGVLVAVFDERNGNDGWARSLARARSTRPSPTPLDLDLLVVVQTAPVAEPGDEAFADGPTQDAAASYATAAAEALDAGLLVDAGFAFAEAARCAQELRDDATANSLYSRAVAVLRAGGTDPVDLVPVVVAWAQAAVATGRIDPFVEAVDALALQVAVEVPASAPEGVALADRNRTERRRAAAVFDDETAQVLASAGPDRETDKAVDRAVRAAQAYADLGAPADAAHAFLLAARLLDGTDRTDDAVRYLESAVDSFTVALEGPLRPAAQNELFLRRGAALSDLEAVLRETGQDGRADEVLGFTG